MSDWQTTPQSVEAIISGMVTRIRKRARVHLYITEWFEERGLNDEQIANRLDPPVDRATVFRWRKEQHRLNPEKIGKLAQALDLEPEELYRPPGTPSLDAIIRDAPDDVRSMATDIVRRMVGKAS